MKRIALLTVLLLVVGLSLGFAQEAKSSIAWSTAGTASLVWGYNLIDGTNGFDNSSAGEFTLTLVPATAVTKASDAPVYGWITLTTTALQILNGATPAFVANGATAPTAGIVAGPLAISVLEPPGFTYTYAGYVPLFAASAGYATTGAVTPLIAIVGGTTIKYTLADVASFAVNVGSIGDWGVAAGTASATTYTTVVGDGTTATTGTAGTSYLEPATGGVTLDATLTAGKLYIKKVVTDPAAGTAGKDYAFGADVSLLAVKGLTLNAGADYNMASKALIIGAQAGYAMAPISVLFGMDATDDTTATVNGLTFDASGNVTLTLGKEVIAANLYADNVAAVAAYPTTTPLRLDTGLTFTDAEGIVKGLNASVGVYAYDLLASPANNPMKVAFGETVSYQAALSDTTYVKPFETVYYNLVDKKTYIDGGIAAALIPNTVFTLEYTAGAIGYDNNVAIVATDMAAAAVVKLTTTISY